MRELAAHAAEVHRRWRRTRPRGLAVVLLAAAGGLSAASPPAGAASSPTSRAVPLPRQPGEVIHAVVEQRGLDVVLELFDPAGALLLTIDSPNGDRGEEELFAVAPSAGEYRLVLRAAAPLSPDRYVLHLGPARSATAVDGERARGFAVLAEARSLRQPAAAARSFAAAAAHFGAAGDRWHEAESRRWWSDACARSGQPLCEAEQRRLALAAFRDLGDLWKQAVLMQSEGEHDRREGRRDAARLAFRLAATLFRGSLYPEGEVSPLASLAHMLAEEGRLQEALDAFDRVRERWRAVGEPFEQATALSDLADLYSELGATERARYLLSDVARRERAVEGEVRPATLIRLGRLDESTGHPAEAAARFREAIDRASASGRGDSVKLATQELGRVLLATGDLAGARAAAEQAWRQFTRQGATAWAAVALKSRAAVAAADGRCGEAIAGFRRALPDLDQADLRAETLTRLARCEATVGELAAAHRDSERALDLLERLRGSPDVVELRRDFLAARQESFDVAVDVAMRLAEQHPEGGWVETALTISERGRARGLLDLLARPRAATGDLRLREAGREVDRLDERVRRLQREGAPDSALTDLRGNLIEALYREWELEAAATVPAEGSSTPSADRSRPLTAVEIRAGLAADGPLLLVYALGTEQSHLWLVDRRSVTHRPLPPRRQIEDAIAGFTRTVEGRTLATSRQQSARRLGELLLGPAREAIHGRRLVVVPDGALQRVPFAALRLGPAGGESPFLVAEHEIAVAPSATAFVLLTRRAGRGGGAAPRVVVLADPVFDSEDPRLGGGDATPPPADSLRALRGLGVERLPRLAATRREAEVIRSLLPSDRSRIYLGFSARRELVTGGELGGFTVIHFATHALIHPEHSDLSGLVLSMLDAAGRRQQGFLRVREIRQLDLTADLIVLSACSTAEGERVEGEGLIGLPDAFLEAGAAAVVASLWDVGDEATARLMESFYRGYLGRGRSPAAALAAAQRHAITAGYPPADWAGFSVVGDGW